MSKQKDNIINLVKIDIGIQEIYKKLMELEKENKKNSKEYKELIDLVMEARKIEKEKLSLVNTDQLIDTYNEFGVDTLMFVVGEIANTDEFSKANNIENNLIYQRIINTINDKNLEEYLIYEKNKTKKIKEEIIEWLITKSMDVIKPDIIDEFINNKNFSKIKDKLLLLKYESLFFNKDLEDNNTHYIKNIKNFLVNTTFTQDEVNSLFDKKVEELVNESLNIMFSLTNDEFENNNNETLFYLALELCQTKTIFRIIQNEEHSIKPYYQLYKGLFANDNFKEEREKASTSMELLKKILLDELLRSKAKKKVTIEKKKMKK